MVKRSLFFANRAHLALRNRQLVIQTREGESTRPIEDLGYVVLEHPEITMTQFAAEALLENNTAVIFCGRDHLPKGMLLPLTGHQTQNQRFRHQVQASLALHKNLWMQTVKQKIRNQAKLLELTGSRVDLLTMAGLVRSGDPDNREGQAARRYFPALFGTDFRRERGGIPPNVRLNYGYAVLRAAVARALTGSGLLPTLGIHHHNKYNAYCLADDVMEPYRPFVDREVWALGQEEGPSNELSSAVKQRLVQITQVDCAIGGKRRPLMLALQESAASLAQCFLGEKRKISYGRFPEE